MSTTKQLKKLNKIYLKELKYQQVLRLQEELNK